MGSESDEPPPESWIEGALEETSPHHVPAPFAKRAFAPWHKPRKQYVRHHQWRLALERVLSGLPGGQGTVSYLGLTGPDLLDIRDFAPACAERGKKLRFLGFKTTGPPEDETALRVAMNEVKSSVAVDGLSDVIPDRLQNMANQHAVAYARAQEYGPFDVVNLDLCDSVAAGGSGGEPKHYDVIMRLFAIQRRRTQPWALLLTSRADRSAIQATDLSKMAGCVGKNVRTYAPFAAGVRDAFSLELAEDLGRDAPEIVATERLGERDFLRFFGLCVGKWLLETATRDLPRTKVEMLPAFCYQVHAAPDMLALAFIITPPPGVAVDPARLAEFAQEPSPDEALMGMDIFKQVTSVEDIDQILAEHGHVREQMVTESADLLAKAGYPRAEYLNFASPN